MNWWMSVDTTRNKIPKRLKCVRKDSREGGKVGQQKSEITTVVKEFGIKRVQEKRAY
jgi:hypothetical protein